MPDDTNGPAALRVCALDRDCQARKLFFVRLHLVEESAKLPFAERDERGRGLALALQSGLLRGCRQFLLPGPCQRRQRGGKISG